MANHGPRCFLDCCWPARLAEMSARIDAQRQWAPRAFVLATLCRAATSPAPARRSPPARRRPVARPRRATVAARSPRARQPRQLPATKSVPAMSPPAPTREDLARTLPPAPRSTVKPSRQDLEVERRRSARTDHISLPEALDRQLNVPVAPPRKVELRDVADQAVKLRPRRETDEGADQVVVRHRRKHSIAAAAERTKLTVGRRAEPDESPLPCVPVDLGAIGGSSFDVRPAWGGGEVGSVRASKQQPAATSGVKESHE